MAMVARPWWRASGTCPGVSRAPFSRGRHAGTIRRCLRCGAVPLEPRAGEGPIDSVDRLEQVDDVGELCRLL